VCIKKQTHDFVFMLVSINMTLETIPKKKDCSISVKENRGSNMYQLGKKIFDKIPILRPMLIKGQQNFRPKFSGIGMTSFHTLPDEQFFKKIMSELHKFSTNENQYCYSDKMMDENYWKFYFVAFASSYAVKSTGLSSLVECGVANGYSAFVALKSVKNSEMHLYDAWNVMKDDLISESEKAIRGYYKTLDINFTKYNLKEFGSTRWHQGYIPETLDNSSPKLISYLHIDLNSSIPTFEALTFFYPKILNGGVILFDDYGLNDYAETKQVIDQFLINKNGTMFKLPTGQAMFFVLKP